MVFLIVVLSFYYLLNDRMKIWFLLLMSYVFYGFWDPQLCALIMLSTVVDYHCGRRLGALQPALRKTQGKGWLWLSLAVNLGLLGFFKYYDFFVEEFIHAAGWAGMSLDADRYLLRLVLPVGISFYTFQTLSYSIDVYRKKVKANRDLVAFLSYVSFFPQLVAGPIERASNLLPQFTKSRTLEMSVLRLGFLQILWGLFKKVVIADNVALFANPFFTAALTPGQISFADAWLGTLAFTLQIYFDFSAYLGLDWRFPSYPNFHRQFGMLGKQLVPLFSM